ncbi:3-deoxy-D-manno-octulosonic acid transferase [Flammeovirga agarivorans]|uniref:3-deoxy-D-manno-octulosonic acid transferase n=1 Tax=Flammeovirga agarivorans TaxID=2726742 RepID=A0A7X8SGY8_9BACT|nr:glycosyltransferase N-terminal domain-containing protein [Flammeovirga agarivorans]NLR89999.1 3-deoxy-D-manno-octulosonic acid transferase [Flammeovirga agarivorans]
MMEETLYNLGTTAFSGAMKLASYLHPKAKLFVEGRKNLLEKVESDFANNNSTVAWFHCASLGEFEQGRPVIEEYKTQFPTHKVVLTFFSPSGYEVQKDYDSADFIYYLPLDKPQNTKRFVDAIQPKIAFFVKYEFWHNYLKALKAINATVVSFSTIFRKDQAFFKNKDGFQQNMLKQFDYFFTQDQNSYDLLSSINIDNKEVAGDTRFDRVAEICNHPKQIPLAEQFSKDATTLVVGSSWPRDIEALRLVASELEDIKIIVAPHEISDKKINHIKDTFSTRKAILFSEATEQNIIDKNLFIIDNVGMLSSLYQFADFAFVGGAFKEGLHNILEPATFGIPIVIGKEFKKFNEAIELVKRKGTFSITDVNSCLSIFNKLNSDLEFRKKSGKITKGYVQENLGSTEKIITYCKKQLQ